MSSVKPDLFCSYACLAQPCSRLPAALAGLLLLLVTGIATAQGPAATPMVVLGLSSSYALKADGTVMVWGNNGSGELGLGNYAQQTTPQPNVGLSNVRALVAGYYHAFAMLNDGTVKGWGYNWYSELGLSGGGEFTTVQPIPALSNVVTLAGGAHHSLALLSNGTVKAWGSNHVGQLGLGHTVNQTLPQLIPGLTNVIALAAGEDLSIALMADGTVKAWGQNDYSQLGLGHNLTQSTPQVIPGLSGVTAVATLIKHCVALLADGTVMAWGMNTAGQLGLGYSSAFQGTPQAIPGLSNVTHLATGYEHTYALLSDGTVKSWGGNSEGQLGNAGPSYGQFLPQTIPGLSSVAAIDTGAAHILALLSNGDVKSWGRNGYGQLGLGNNLWQSTPQLIPGLSLCSAGLYSLSISSLGSEAVGIVIPWNCEVGTLGMGNYYFNAFSADPLNATSPGTGVWHGLHTTQAEVLAWLNAGASGCSIAFGSLGVSGAATASIAIPPAQLAGLTIHGVSVAINPLTALVVADSNVASHTF